MTATLTGPPPVTALPHRPPSPTSDPVQAFRDGLFKFTSADAERMVKLGILPEDSTVELLGGVLVHRDCGSSKGEPGVPGLEHDYVVSTIADLNPRIANPSRHLRTQISVMLPGNYSPIPDAVVLRGPLTAYRERQATAADVLCLIEVADTSYARDAGEKLAAYARAGVPQYVIVNLRDRTAEVYAGPDVAAGTYPPPVVVPGVGGTLLLHVGEGETFSVDLAALLP
jgi:hypothetical protein